MHFPEESAGTRQEGSLYGRKNAPVSHYKTPWQKANNNDVSLSAQAGEQEVKILVKGVGRYRGILPIMIEEP